MESVKFADCTGTHSTDVLSSDWVITEYARVVGSLDTHRACALMPKVKGEAKDPQITWMGQRGMVWIWEVVRRNQTKIQIPNRNTPKDPVNKDKVRRITTSTI